MIRFVQGDIFQSRSQTLVATVNCVGIMGKGLAKEFRLRFPAMFREYQKACKKGLLRRGQLFLYKDLLGLSILCFPTKDNWKGPSKYEFIEDGLQALVNHYKEWGINSIALPPLGCGLGGLDWVKVKRLIIKHLSNLPIDVEVFEPLETGERVPTKNPFRKIDKIRFTPALVYTGEMIRIGHENFQHVGRLLLQKIAFFSQMKGLPIKLKFKEYKLGPYDDKLKFNVDRLEGLYVRDASTTLTRSDLKIIDQNDWLKAVTSADVDLEDARRKIQETVFFLKSFSIEEIELLSTVLSAWVSVVASGNTGRVEQVEKYIDKWKPQKYSHEQMREAYDILEKRDWINPHSREFSAAEEGKEISLE